MADESGGGDGGSGGDPEWPSVDGALGAQPEKALNQARLLFYAGFLLLPWLWFMNCFYFWPVLRSRAHSAIRPYVVLSGIGFLAYSAILLSWALAFSIGGEAIVGRTLWKKLAVMTIVEEYQLN
ncbi:hypothetical protein SELMODRAFT_73466 [Selaginella moellendorffii]|uniref:Gamma-secretase subunit PEN-2 n=2 Tax=Selaginella moellendorffii TaxID=88036 RepID=D8QNW3_SELML|nr:hypothetical protein SELMODRAFT_117951 [Selaginella moellendorffii]EFJ38180.1 hypothetical protein SELMODRAFT_73466 [Selaginella moellendorffii]